MAFTDKVTVVGVQYTNEQGVMMAGAPYMEVWIESCLGGVATILTPQDARLLAALLERAADAIEQVAA